MLNQALQVKNQLRRAVRLARLGANLAGGGTLIESLHRFPRWSKIEDNHLNDYRLFNYWVEDLVHSMNTELEIIGEPILEHGMFVCNHMSWLDTIVLNHAKMLSFIARHDLVEWPFIGTFTDRMHSLFIDRTNKFSAYRSLPKIEDRLREGRSVLVFPESTTSSGKDLLPFFPMFLEAAVTTKLPVQPVYLSYKNANGELIDEPAFIDDDSFVDTLSRVLWVDKIHATLNFLPPLDSNTLDRKELAWEARKAIGRASLANSSK